MYSINTNTIQELMCFRKHEYQPISTLTMLCKLTTPSGLKVAYDEQMGKTLSLAEIWLENTPYTDPHETFDPKVDQVRLKSANGRGTNFCRPICRVHERHS